MFPDADGPVITCFFFIPNDSKIGKKRGLPPKRHDKNLFLRSHNTLISLAFSNSFAQLENYEFDLTKNAHSIFCCK